jgi:hypothetical protein
MRMPYERGCPRCGGRDVTFQRPKPSTLIHQIGMTARTRYCGTREVFNGC